VSFDLSLFPREGQPPLDRETFLGYFQGKLFEQSDDQVSYSNQDTGVYFSLTWYGGRESNESDEEGTPRPWRQQPYVHFNMNYYRPHTFGLEAERVLTPFVGKFGLVVDDPQTEGMGQGEYSPEGFLQSWNAGNRFAASAMRQMKQRGEKMLTGTLSLPSESNRLIWEWNYTREEICEELLEGELIGVFVPLIMLFREADQVRTFCIFPNLVPTAIPKVDRVFILRTELPEPYDGDSKETPGWVSWDELRATAAEFEVREEDAPLPFLLLFGEDYASQETAPRNLARWVAGLPDWPDKPDFVAMDQVFDAELVAQDTNIT
jgi:hypothetical protein